MSGLLLGELRSRLDYYRQHPGVHDGGQAQTLRAAFRALLSTAAHAGYRQPHITASLACGEAFGRSIFGLRPMGDGRTDPTCLVMLAGVRSSIGEVLHGDTLEGALLAFEHAWQSIYDGYVEDLEGEGGRAS